MRNMPRVSYICRYVARARYLPVLHRKKPTRAILGAHGPSAIGGGRALLRDIRDQDMRSRQQAKRDLVKFLDDRYGIQRSQIPLELSAGERARRDRETLKRATANSEKLLAVLREVPGLSKKLLLGR